MACSLCPRKKVGVLPYVPQFLCQCSGMLPHPGSPRDTAPHFEDWGFHLDLLPLLQPLSCLGGPSPSVNFWVSRGSWEGLEKGIMIVTHLNSFGDQNSFQFLPCSTQHHKSLRSVLLVSWTYMNSEHRANGSFLRRCFYWHTILG